MCLAVLQAYRYEHFTSDTLLCLMPSAPTFDQDGRHLQLNEVSLVTYIHLNKYARNLAVAVKELQTLRH